LERRRDELEAWMDIRCVLFHALPTWSNARVSIASLGATVNPVGASAPAFVDVGRPPPLSCLAVWIRGSRAEEVR
jgi:hypothetical protein